MEDSSALNPGWRTSRYTAQSGSGTCVEVGAIPWRKSSYTAQSGAGTCVEAGHVPGAVLVRDTTQHGTGPVLRVTPCDWVRFTRAIRATAPIG